MSSLLRRDQRRPVIFSICALVIFLLLVTQHDHIPAPKALTRPWKSNQDLPVPVNHGTDDFEVDAGDEGNYTGEKHPVATPSDTTTIHEYLVKTDEETTIPITTSSSDPNVRVAAHAYGFTIFDKLYLRNGTFFVVTEDSSSMPPRDGILSKGSAMMGSEESNPTDEELRFIKPSQAKEHLGEHATLVKDVTVFIYDPVVFLPHYYHFWGEIIIGAWRVYSTLGLGSSPSLDRLPIPARWVMPFAESDSDWRDRAGLDGPLMRLAFPGTTIEQAGQWKDWKRAGTTVVFERGMIVNRVSAHKSPLGSVWPKMISSTMNLTVPNGFWEPLRTTLTRNLFGYVPQVKSDGTPSVPPPFNKHPNSGSKPVVTYISRQKTGRRLTDEDHRGLVTALRELEEEGVCEVRIPVMESMSLGEQLAEVASSTILVGVHGNGLTHQLWMPPSLRSAVLEIVYPPGYVFDYEILARNVGHKHYIIRNDTMVTFKPGDWYRGGIHVPDGFHAEHIPVHGQFVADLIRKRLTQPEGEVEP